MRAAIYTRVSTQEQRDEGISLDMQRQRCSERAHADGAVTTEVFEDGGLSGSQMDNRPALQELLAKADCLDVVYCWKLDRLSRNVEHTARIMRKLAGAGVRLVSVSENFDMSTGMGQAMAAMASVFAQLFLSTLRENILAALAESARQGKHHGPAPFGYQHSRDKAIRLEPDPAQLPYLREMFDRYLHGDSISGVTKWLQTTPARDFRKWSATQVAKILRCRTYLGELVWKGEVYQANHEAIIDRDLFDAVQKRLDANSLVPPTTRKHSLSPVFRCGICGSPVSVLHNSGEKHSYRCIARMNLPRAQQHEANSILLPVVEALTWRAVQYFISTEAIREGYQRHRGNEAGARRKELLKRREELEAALEYNLQAARAGAVDVAILARQNAPLMASLEKVDQQLAGAEREEQAVNTLQAVTPEELVRMVQSSDIEAQRNFLLRFFQRVEIHKAFLRFVPTIPDVPPFEVARPNIPRGRKEAGWLRELPFCLLTGGHYPDRRPRRSSRC